MRLQVAIDRVDVVTASQIMQETGGLADIIEVGTSLIKDYGLAASVGALKAAYPGQTLLADIKTIDEGAYEFERAYQAGSDIATVMGGAALATISACQQVAAAFGRAYMIDLLEVEHARMLSLTAFSDAIFCLHLPSDLAGAGLRELVEHNRVRLSGVARMAVAGGVTLESLPLLKAAGVEIAVVGGAITKSGDVAAAVRQFKKAMDA